MVSPHLSPPCWMYYWYYLFSWWLVVMATWWDCVIGMYCVEIFSHFLSEDQKMSPSFVLSMAVLLTGRYDLSYFTFCVLRINNEALTPFFTSPSSLHFQTFNWNKFARNWKFLLKLVCHLRTVKYKQVICGLYLHLVLCQVPIGYSIPLTWHRLTWRCHRDLNWFYIPGQLKFIAY